MELLPANLYSMGVGQRVAEAVAVSESDLVMYSQKQISGPFYCTHHALRPPRQIKLCVGLSMHCPEDIPINSTSRIFGKNTAAVKH